MDGGAFAMLAAPVQAAAEASGDPSKLIAFFAQEMQLFFAHIQKAVTHYSSTGELPHSAFKSKDVKALDKAGKRKRGEGKKRKPSGFNLFMKEKLEELKAKGVKGEGEGKGAHQALFKMAAEEWKTLDDGEKEAFKKRAAAMSADGEAGAGGDHAAAGAAEEEEEEESGSESESDSESESESESPEPVKVEPEPAKKKKSKK